MKRVLCLVSGTLLVSATALAQPPGGGQQLDVATSLQRAYNGVKMNLTAAADEMPEADYTFKPGPAPELRTFGQAVAHTAAAQFSYCSALSGTANPMQGKNLEQDLKTKAEFVKALADSFALCDRAFSSLSMSNANEFVTQGRGQISKSALAANVVIHDNEMYGTIAVYMRAKGMVPPSTERMQQMRGGRGRGGQ
jgi:uncharacterized damage-inducible protein DinB